MDGPSLDVIADLAGKGRGVVYSGTGPLPADTPLAVVRCLLVRGDAYDEYMANTSARSRAFWRRYSISTHINERAWHCLPVGDLIAYGEATWHREGTIEGENLLAAWQALGEDTLVEWQRHATWHPRGTASPPTIASIVSRPPSGTGAAAGAPIQLLTAGHLLNEPSGDEQPTVRWEWSNKERSSGQCDSSTERWCGALLLARSSRTLHHGDELMWCYGRNYARDYEVGLACSDPASRWIGPRTASEFRV